MPSKKYYDSYNAYRRTEEFKIKHREQSRERAKKAKIQDEKNADEMFYDFMSTLR